MLLLGGNAWVVRTVDVFLLPLALLLVVDLIETRLLRLRQLLIVLLIVVVLLLLLRRSDRCWLITRIMLRSLAAYVGSGR